MIVTVAAGLIAGCSEEGDVSSLLLPSAFKRGKVQARLPVACSQHSRIHASVHKGAEARGPVASRLGIIRRFERTKRPALARASPSPSTGTHVCSCAGMLVNTRARKLHVRAIPTRTTPAPLASCPRANTHTSQDEGCTRLLPSPTLPRSTGLPTRPAHLRTVPSPTLSLGRQAQRLISAPPILSAAAPSSALLQLPPGRGDIPCGRP